jgi:hypothetical protein
MNKTRKRLLIILIGFICVYFLLLLFPSIFFKHKIEYKSFIIYSHSETGKKIFPILDSAENLIRYSDLYKKGTGKFKVFLCNSFFEYSVFAPTERNAFASNNILTNNIFLSKSDIDQNRVERHNDENNLRTLSGVIAHEATHTLIKRDLGFISYLLLDTWKNEGYSDFIAKESSFEYIIGMYFICNSKTPSSPSFKYFKYRMYLQYLIDVKGLSFNQIANQNFKLTDLDKEIQKKYCGK